MRKISIRTYICIIMVAVLLLGGGISNYASAASETYYLGGFACGFSLKTKGAEVVGVSDVFTGNATVSPARDSGIAAGDMLISIDNTEISGSKDIAKALKGYGGSGTVVAVLKRNGTTIVKELTPVKDVNGNYKLGLFVRDSLNGIGTVTFIKKNGEFMALGHPVIDENSEVLNINGGGLYNCKIIGVNAGERGKAGELKGVFCRDETIGSISANTEQGLKGKLKQNFDASTLKECKTASPKQGKASIFSTISERGTEEFSCSIVRVDDLKKESKNFVVKITDERLLETSGGIVQGMSGSPLVQNGKIIGAVTHVFVNDPTRGYGISIDNMLRA